MSTQFDKALEQVARAESDLEADRLALESRAQKVLRLEELIRAKEATGDRIVIGIGVALVVSAMALPVYAAFYSDGQAYLPSVGGSLVNWPNSNADKPSLFAASSQSSTTDRQSASASADRAEGSYARTRGGDSSFARYVIHRATDASALIEGPNGLWWVTPGMKIPGAGQILSIERSVNGWTVVTSETTITEVSEARF